MTTIKRYTKGFFRYLHNNRAVSALEYAILAGVITVGVAAALGTFSTAVTDFIGKIGTEISETDCRRYRPNRHLRIIPLEQRLSFFGHRGWRCPLARDAAPGMPLKD